MALRSYGQELLAYPQDDPALPTTSTGDSAIESTVDYHQGWPASGGDEAMYFDNPLPVDTALPLSVYAQVGTEYYFLPYQASPARLSAI
jgi:hypothetical protein